MNITAQIAPLRRLTATVGGIGKSGKGFQPAHAVIIVGLSLFGLVGKATIIQEGL
jgi:hypothetical protein